MKTMPRIMFLRSKANQPCGCVAISLSRDSGLINYNISVLNPADKFERALARQIAIGRLIETPRTVVASPSSSMHDISHAVMFDISQSTTLPVRAIKAASLWLENEKNEIVSTSVEDEKPYELALISKSKKKASNKEEVIIEQKVPSFVKTAKSNKGKGLVLETLAKGETKTIQTKSSGKTRKLVRSAKK